MNIDDYKKAMKKVDLSDIKDKEIYDYNISYEQNSYKASNNIDNRALRASKAFRYVLVMLACAVIAGTSIYAFDEINKNHQYDGNNKNEGKEHDYIDGKESNTNSTSGNMSVKLDKAVIKNGTADLWISITSSLGSPMPFVTYSYFDEGYITDGKSKADINQCKRVDDMTDSSVIRYKLTINNHDLDKMDDNNLKLHLKDLCYDIITVDDTGFTPLELFLCLKNNMVNNSRKYIDLQLIKVSASNLEVNNAIVEHYMDVSFKCSDAKSIDAIYSMLLINNRTGETIYPEEDLVYGVNNHERKTNVVINEDGSYSIRFRLKGEVDDEILKDYRLGLLRETKTAKIEGEWEIGIENKSIRELIYDTSMVVKLDSFYMNIKKVLVSDGYIKISGYKAENIDKAPGYPYSFDNFGIKALDKDGNVICEVQKSGDFIFGSDVGSNCAFELMTNELFDKESVYALYFGEHYIKLK